MASTTFLRAGVQSPARSMMRPMSKSILKRPAPLPLSPNALTANFSVVVSAGKGSAHVRFPESPSLVAGTFTAHSANTYDRGPIVTSPMSADHSSWMGRMLSPTAHNAFRLSDPPKRTPVTGKQRQSFLAPPPAAVTVASNTLAPPAPFVDPRSPKPYVPRAGVSFDEITLYVPKPGDLGRALMTYPRSPYPSAPLEAEEMDIADEMSTRGRSTERSNAPSGFTRARSIDNKTKRLRNGQNSSMLSPGIQSPRVIVTPSQPRAPQLSVSPESQLNQEFWAAVTLEDSPSVAKSALKSPRLMFGGVDGSLYSPRPNKTRESRSMVDNGFLSPVPRKQTFKKGMVASPSPNDPYASFPSFTLALNSNMGGTIAYPPRALVE